MGRGDYLERLHGFGIELTEDGGISFPVEPLVNTKARVYQEAVEVGLSLVFTKHRSPIWIQVPSQIIQPQQSGPT